MLSDSETDAGLDSNSLDIDCMDTDSDHTGVVAEDALEDIVDRDALEDAADKDSDTLEDAVDADQLPEPKEHFYTTSVSLS